VSLPPSREPGPRTVQLTDIFQTKFYDYIVTALLSNAHAIPCRPGLISWCRVARFPLRGAKPEACLKAASVVNLIPLPAVLPGDSSSRRSADAPSSTALGFLLREVIDDLHIKPRDLFRELSLGAPLLAREALLIACRTRLGLRPSSFSDASIEVYGSAPLELACYLDHNSWV